MKLTDNIVKLAEELGVQRPLLYQWEAAAEGRGRNSQSRQPSGSAPPPKESEAALRQEVNWLREALAKKVKEADFFRGALQKVEARRQGSASPGGTESTTKCEN
jgi:transposase-like protein